LSSRACNHRPSIRKRTTDDLPGIGGHDLVRLRGFHQHASSQIVEPTTELVYQNVLIPVEGSASVPGIWCLPESAVACVVLAPGGTSDMRSPLLEGIAEALARRGVASLRYNFPYMQRLSRMLDLPTTLYRTVAAAVSTARALAPGLPLVAGGRAFGSRTTSVAVSRNLVAGVDGLVFIGFPLHPMTRRATTSATHLTKTSVPLLFVQGTRDESADADLVIEVIGQLGPRASVRWIEQADHSFKMPGEGARSPISTAQPVGDAISMWMLQRIAVAASAVKP
jgi:predicted alpha/beta-hydrolase family hydrolase